MGGGGLESCENQCLSSRRYYDSSLHLSRCPGEQHEINSSAMLVYRHPPPHKRATGAKTKTGAKSKTKTKSKSPPGKLSQQPTSEAVIPPQVQVKHSTGTPPFPSTYAQAAPYSQLVPHVPSPNHDRVPPQPSPYGYEHPPAFTHERPWMDTLPVQGCNDLTEIIRRPIEATLNGLEQWHQWGSDYLHHGSGHSSGVCDLISSKFNAVLTSIDGEAFSGDERELGRQLDSPHAQGWYTDCSQLYILRPILPFGGDGAFRVGKSPRRQTTPFRRLSQAPKVPTTLPR